MKRLISLIVIFFFFHSQVYSQNAPSFDSQAVRLGIAIGPTLNLASSYGASLSPNNNTLQIDRNSNLGLKLSTCIVYNRNHLWKVTGKDNKEIQYKYPGKLSYVAALNIAELSNGNLGMNKSIDGGIGIGFRIDPNFHIISLLEFSSARQIRNYLRSDFQNRPIITSDGSSLNALDDTDNRYFFSKTIPGISIRFVYVFGKSDSNLDSAERVK
jgi:hypothetical protein